MSGKLLRTLNQHLCRNQLLLLQDLPLHLLQALKQPHLQLHLPQMLKSLNQLKLKTRRKFRQKSLNNKPLLKPPRALYQSRVLLQTRVLLDQLLELHNPLTDESLVSSLAGAAGSKAASLCLAVKQAQVEEVVESLAGLVVSVEDVELVLDVAELTLVQLRPGMLHRVVLDAAI